MKSTETRRMPLVVAAAVVALIFTTGTQSNAQTAWARTYEGAAFSTGFSTAVATDRSRNVIATGFIGTAETLDNFYTVKYSPNGVEKWAKTYVGPVGNSRALALAVDREGNVVVTGWSNNPNGRLDFCTIKYGAESGEQLWEVRYEGTNFKDDIPVAIALDRAGNVFVTGKSSGTSLFLDFYTVKYAATTGAKLWEKRYAGPTTGHDSPASLVVDGQGNVIVTGSSLNGSNLDFYTVKYNGSNGSEMWTQRYNGPTNGTDVPTAIAVDPYNNILVVGSSEENLNSDFYTAKYSGSNGAVLWQKRFNGSSNSVDRACAVTVDSLGDVFVTGGSVVGISTDYQTIKYAGTNGKILWKKRYDSLSHGTDQPHSIALDENENVVVSGDSEGGNLTLKLRNSNGARLLKRKCPGLFPFGESLHGMAVDRQGAIVVSGYGVGTAGPNKFKTIKYKTGP